MPSKSDITKGFCYSCLFINDSYLTWFLQRHWKLGIWANLFMCKGDRGYPCLTPKHHATWNLAFLPYCNYLFSNPLGCKCILSVDIVSYCLPQSTIGICLLKARTLKPFPALKPSNSVSTTDNHLNIPWLMTVWFKIFQLLMVWQRYIFQ